MIFPRSIGFDVETNGDKAEYALQPFRATYGQAKIKSVSMAVTDRTSGKLYPSIEYLRTMLNLALKLDAYVVGWNVVFDAAWLIASGLEYEVFQVKWLDAMLLWKHAVVEPEGEDVPKTKRKSYSLESAMHEFYPDDAEFKEFKDFEATDAESLDLLLHRNKMDALWTLRLAEKFWNMLEDRQQIAALIEARCIPAMAKTKVLGLVANPSAAQELAGKLEQEAISIYRDLLATSPEVHGVNLGSPKQLQKLLYEDWKLPVDRFSKKTGDPSTDKYALFFLATLDPRAHLLKKLREAKNNRKKYAIGTLNSLAYNGDGVVRPQAKIFSTYTSRITYGSSDKAEIEVVKETKKNGIVRLVKKGEVPVGVALHQWKRGKEYRRLIQPPPGYLLAEFDFAGQEFRWMAVASLDETMLSLCAPGEDAHSYMGAQIAQRSYKGLVQAVKDGDAEAANDRKCGKFCVAEGELVLTDKGLVPIEEVSLDMRVWDGIEWVNHEGLIDQGPQEVMTYAGLTATPDHKVFTKEKGSVRLDEAAEEGYLLVVSGLGRTEIRVSDNLFAGNKEVEGEPPGCMCPMHLCLRENFVGIPIESDVEEIDTVSRVCVEGTAFEERACQHQQCCGTTSTEEMRSNATEMLKPKRSAVQELRRERNRVQVQKWGRGNSLHFERASAPDIPLAGNRQKRQQRPLRTRELEAGDLCGEPEQQAYQSISRLRRSEDPSQARVPCVTYLIPGGDVYRASDMESGMQGADHRTDGGKMACPKLQTKRTYDLANAGPRHRFTVSGKLVANCNLSYQYRVSAKTATLKAIVDYEMAVDETFIKQTLAIYKKSYPGVGGQPHQRIGGYWASQIEKCKRLGYAETFAGRRVQLKGNWAGKTAWPLESTAINYPIQGTGGDQKYLALAVARNLLPQFGGYFYYELHDGLFFIFPEDKAVAASQVFLNELSNLPYAKAWGVNLPIQFPVDAKIGVSWGDLMDLEKFK